MAIVRKFTIGVMPFAKMFRIHGQGGAATDAVLHLRSKSLPEDFFSEVATNPERTAYRVNSVDQLNTLQLTEESVNFSKDYYEAEVSFDFRKVLEEFRLIWAAVNSVLNVQDIRRIGMVAEYRCAIDSSAPSAWLRQKLTSMPTSLATAKFNLQYEERELAADGTLPDPKKSGFINYIYRYYDSAMDANHPLPDYVDVDLDVQHYFAPLLNGNVGDEVLKLHHHFDSAQQRLSKSLKAMGASYVKR